MRVGQGFDLHALVRGRPLVLGGVDIPSEVGLEGHSDADVLAHALGDALLGAIGAGDLGTHFPSSDPAWKGARSADLLERIVRRLKSSGYRLVNVDATLIAEVPRLAEHREAIAKGLASMACVEPTRVNVKLKSADRLGAIGRGEGIGALVIVLVEEAES